ncbi:MAG: YbhB/YbcL family Raf kinase inhibitor-like protein [Microbacteriaceae bacterium]|nr:YbhB/YbcL family Raf kinase inhibitor-like protein [Microbacteriaceae bacterium]
MSILPQNNPYEQLAEVPEIAIDAGFENGETLPLSYVNAEQGGDPTSPALSWEPVEGAESYTVSLYDPDAPTMSGFWHWIVTDIPANVTSLEAGELPEGATAQLNEAGERDFIPATPPAGHGYHRYFLTVQALNVPKLDLPADLTPARLHFSLRENVIARGHVFGIWQNPEQ